MTRWSIGIAFSDSFLAEVAINQRHRQQQQGEAMKPNQLKKSRRHLQLSQYELARITKISRYKLSCFECGYIDLSVQEVKQIKNEFKKRGAK